MSILKRYKNLLFTEISKGGLNPEDFQVEHGDSPGKAYFTLKYGNTPLEFTIQQHLEVYHLVHVYYTTFAPGYTKKYSYDLNNVTLPLQFSSWLNSHVKEFIGEVVAPDFWEAIRNKQQFLKELMFRPEAETCNIPFEESDKKSIRVALHNFFFLIRDNLQLHEDQLKSVNAHLEFLSSALDRLHKVDWRNGAISVLISIAVALTLDTEKGRLLFRLFKDAMSAVTHLLR